MARSTFPAACRVALVLLLAHTAQAARVLAPRQPEQQRRSLRLAQGPADGSLSESLKIDLHTRLEGIPGYCSEYVWLFVGPKPAITPAPGAYSFVFDNCLEPTAASVKAAAASAKAVSVVFPPNAQKAGGAQAAPAAAASAASDGVTSIKVKLYDASKLTGVTSGAGIACTWAQHEAEATTGATAGGATAVYSCDSCGQVAVDASCQPAEAAQQRCVPVTVTCAFGRGSSYCSGASCYGR